MTRTKLFILAAGSLCLWAAGCSISKKYSVYRSPYKDFVCEVPSQWTAVLDQSGKDFYRILWTGPFEPNFHKGVPSLNVYWYRYRAPHRLPNGRYEMYSSSRDFLVQTMRDVYGPDGIFQGDADRERDKAVAAQKPLPDIQVLRVSQNRLPGYYFVVYHNAPAGPKDLRGVSLDGKGHRLIRQRHGYVLVPLATGLYVIVYPATYDGFEKFRPEFNHLLKTFTVQREGPA